jgi:glycosyltransferase involved in cell wall biosynthesis
VDEGRLRSRRNIHILGEKSRAELPGYLKGMAVALIPYRPNDLTRNIFPLKLFEYLAAGVPVVAGGLPELDRYSGVIGVARAPEDYPRLARQAISLDTADSRAIRVELAAQNSWDDRVEDISRLVEEALARAGRAPEK